MAYTRIAIIGSVLIVAAGLTIQFANAHCQVPCGIYDDELRIAKLAEDITTIDKAIDQINELSTQRPRNLNQINRWIAAKEQHADSIAHTVTYYFMAQRIKLPEGDARIADVPYVKKLTLLHSLLVLSMKAKQTTDPAVVDDMRQTLRQFTRAYSAGTAVTPAEDKGTGERRENRWIHRHGTADDHDD